LYVGAAPDKNQAGFTLSDLAAIHGAGTPKSFWILAHRRAFAGRTGAALGTPDGVSWHIGSTPSQAILIIVKTRGFQTGGWRSSRCAAEAWLGRTMEDHLVSDGEWQHAFQRVLLETDNKKLHDLIVVAEAAIFNRLQVLASNPRCQEERQLIFDALGRLRGLMTDVLGFPDWQKR